VKVKKLFNKLTEMENEKKKLAEALKLSKVKICRSFRKVKAFENKPTMCK